LRRQDPPALSDLAGAEELFRFQAALAEALQRLLLLKAGERAPLHRTHDSRRRYPETEKRRKVSERLLRLIRQVLIADHTQRPLPYRRQARYVSRPRSMQLITEVFLVADALVSRPIHGGNRLVERDAIVMAVGHGDIERISNDIDGPGRVLERDHRRAAVL